MVRSLTIPRGDGLLEKAATAVPEPARKNSQKAKIENINVDTDVVADANPSSLFLAVDSETHLPDGDYDPESTTTMSNNAKQPPKQKKKKTKKKKTKKNKNKDNAMISTPMTADDSQKADAKSNLELGANIDIDANSRSSFTMNSGTEADVENPYLESITTIPNASLEALKSKAEATKTPRSSKCKAKRTKKEREATESTTTNVMVETLSMDFNLNENEDENDYANENMNANHSGNSDIPMITVTMFLILVSFALSVINDLKRINQFFALSIFLGISIVVLMILWIVKVGRRRNNANTHTSADDETRKFPTDCYSFVALYSPKTDPDLFCFGLIIFLFQSTLFLLMILSVVSPSLRSTGEVDNPDSEVDFFAAFIPSNATPSVRATQIITIVASLVFPDASLLEISTGVQLFPQLCKRNQNEKVWCIAFSCILRCIQGSLAIFAVFLLVMTSSNVTEIILNFTAVNFISLLDDTAFTVAKDGRYGPTLEEAAKRVENEPLPRCSIPKYRHVRHGIAVGVVSAFLFGMMCYVIVCQEKNDTWITQTIQIEFQGSTGVHSGCYDIDVNSSNHKRYNSSNHKRYNYNIFSDNSDFNQTKIGYCKNDRKWVLYNSPDDKPCNAKENEIAAYSTKTDSFDISTSLSETWYSASNEPLDLVLFEPDDDSKDCYSNVDDGICNVFFNKPELKFDGGDCCATTCNHTGCGKGVFNSKSLFGTVIESGDGYPNCKDPDSNVKSVAIEINSISMNDSESKFTLKFECDGDDLFSIPLNQSMANNMEEFPVPRWGNCTFKPGENPQDNEFSWEINYTISRAIDNAHILHEGHVSMKKPTEYFSVYNISDETSLSSRIGDFLQDVTDLTLTNKGFTGTLPTEIGSLTKLTSLTLNYNDFNGTLPSEIGSLTNLKKFGVYWNRFNGTIPSEIGMITALTNLELDENAFTGKLPSEIGMLTKLNVLWLTKNDIAGTVPTEIGFLTNLYGLYIGGNAFTGKLPSEIGLLTKLTKLELKDNYFTGTVPSEIGLLTKLDVLDLSDTLISGPIPENIDFTVGGECEDDCYNASISNTTTYGPKNVNYPSDDSQEGSSMDSSDNVIVLKV